MATPKQLDAVFFYLKNKTELGVEVNAYYIWNFYVSRSTELNIDQMLFADILRKLIADGYVHKSPDEMLHLAVDGRNFKGYIHSNKWYNKISKITITEGLIYSLIAAAIIALITWAIKMK